MSVDEVIEKAKEIKEKAQELVDEWFPDLYKQSPKDYRVTLLSVMRAIIDLRFQEIKTKELEIEERKAGISKEQKE
ncbi:MAG: hypothetical protein ACTSXC_07220 [Candidatus Freyarchaeota archaeon]